MQQFRGRYSGRSILPQEFLVPRPISTMDHSTSTSRAGMMHHKGAGFLCQGLPNSLRCFAGTSAIPPDIHCCALTAAVALCGRGLVSRKPLSNTNACAACRHHHVISHDVSPLHPAEHKLWSLISFMQRQASQMFVIREHIHVGNQSSSAAVILWQDLRCPAGD